jgi:DNA-binding transcriptional ArsR family regulator
MQGLTALSDPTRQRIVEMLASGPLCAGDIAERFDISPPAISQHLKTLREAKLVRVTPQAQRRVYELNPEGVLALAEWVERLRRFWATKLDALETELKRDAP